MYKREKNIKVLIIWRGPSPYRVDFFNELGKLCDLTVLFERRPDQITDKEKSWFHEDFTHFKGIYLKSITFRNTAFSLEQFKYLRKNAEYDYIVIGMYSTFIQMSSLLYLKLFKIPYLLNSDGGFIKKENKITYYIKRFFISGAKAYLSSSKGTSKYLQYYGANNKIMVYPFTTSFQKDVYKNLTAEDKLKYKKILGIKYNVIILFSGQFIYRKGVDILLKAAKNISKQCGIYIVGGEPTREYLSLCKENNLNNVHFIGFTPPQDLAQYYIASDIYVLPTREDIWGLVINEAMAYGLPIITTDNCLAGLELIKNEENGYIIPVNNTELLAQYANLLIDNKSLRDKIAANNRKKIHLYTLENMAKTHIDFLHNLKD